MYVCIYVCMLKITEISESREKMIVEEMPYITK